MQYQEEELWAAVEALRRDVQSLERQVSTLERQVDELQEERSMNGTQRADESPAQQGRNGRLARRQLFKAYRLRSRKGIRIALKAYGSPWME